MQQPLILTVSQLNRYSKSIIDGDSNLNNVFVTGEISNFVDHYRSGHLYMSIKDANASIKAVMFAGNAARLKFKPENGMSVIIRGRVSLYERDGQYQLYIDDMQPDGIGALSLAFEQLKVKLSSEGIFSSEHKLPIPAFPDRVAVISSPTGAAVQDVLNVLGRRFPVAQIIFAGVKVQGESASSEISKAIKKINEFDAADVIIIARGGGSAEDLWQFNSEELAYSIYESHIPIISGVGHETDFTICDFAADLRAPTPSAAAELAVPDLTEQLFYVSSIKNTLSKHVSAKITDCESRLTLLEKSDVLKKPLQIVDNCEMYLDSLFSGVHSAVCKRLDETEAKFALLCKSIENLSPIKVLTRGYSTVMKNERIINSAGDVDVGDEVLINFVDGTVKAKIYEV